MTQKYTVGFSEGPFYSWIRVIPTWIWGIYTRENSGVKKGGGGVAYFWHIGKYAANECLTTVNCYQKLTEDYLKHK